MIGITEVILWIVPGLLIVLIKCMDRNPAPIFGIYERQNGRYWFKVAVMYCIITLHKMKRALFKRTKHNNFYDWEKPQQLPVGHEKAADVVTFNGANKNGDSLHISFVKRPDIVKGYFFLKINDTDLGVITFSNYPDGLLGNPSDSQCEYLSEGLKLVPLIPMNKWRLVFKGKMTEVKKRYFEHNVEIDGMWTSDLPATDLEDGDVLNSAKCIAYEKWSTEFFENLKKFQVKFYEQLGTMQLKVTIDGSIFDLKLDSVRGRGIGYNIDQRHIFKACIHQIYTEKGDYFRIEQICAPIIGSRMLRGYAFNSEEKKISSVKDCSLQLYKYGGIDAPPDDYGFTFIADDKEYNIQVLVQDSPHVYSGQDWQVKTYVKISNFLINGKKGWGTANWIYKNVSGRDSGSCWNTSK